MSTTMTGKARALSNARSLDTSAPAVLLDGIEHGPLLFNATGVVNSTRSAARVRSVLLFDVLKRLHGAGIKLTSPRRC
jgi:potassium-dependent mechanosensitive channel